MHKSALKQMAGVEPLPQKVMDRITLIRYADANHILGQMASAVIPEKDSRLEDIFRNARLRAEHDHRMLQFEMNRLEHALVGTGIEPIILKGGAYVALGRKASKGRRVSDLDILVSEDELEEVEARLKLAGWAADEATDNPYDQAYYRHHMHELPPLRHQKRGTVIDVHHLLLPKTAKSKIDVTTMRQSSVFLEGKRLKVFDNVDLFIHSAVHAFADGAIDTPARSLVELFMLYEELPERDAARLPARANEVGASTPVSIALWAIGRFFDVKNSTVHSKQMMGLKRYLVLRWAITSKTHDGPLAPLAKAFLYVRSHYLRMPLRLLIPHLARKAASWRPNSQKPIELPVP